MYGLRAIAACHHFKLAVALGTVPHNTLGTEGDNMLGTEGDNTLGTEGAREGRPYPARFFTSSTPELRCLAFATVFLPKRWV